MQQSEEMPGLDVVLKLLALVGAEVLFLVPLGQIAHPGLIVVVEAKRQNVTGQTPRQVPVVRLDKARENRDFAVLSSLINRLVAMNSLPPYSNCPAANSQPPSYAQTLRSSDRYPTASAIFCGLISSWPSRSAIVRATRSTLSWARAEAPDLPSPL